MLAGTMRNYAAIDRFKELITAPAAGSLSFVSYSVVARVS
jgi:hypothetical protein